MDQPLPFEDSRSHFETRPVRVVCLHAPQDASYGAALERHLAPLANEGLVEIFHPGLLQGGENTEERLKAESFGRSKLKVQTNAAERANRRVEFWVTRARAASEAPPSTPPATPPAQQQQQREVARDLGRCVLLWKRLSRT